jgi:hypothetical protein
MGQGSQDGFVIEGFVARLIGRALLGLVLLAAVCYVGDFAVWRLRMAAGRGMGSVPVDVYVIGELKGGKEDYYPQGVTAEPCSRSLYPQGGVNPCWWVARHTEKDLKY